MSKTLNPIKVYAVYYRRHYEAVECYLLEAIANETTYTYTFSRQEAEKTGRHRVDKKGPFSPVPRQAMNQFLKDATRDAENAQRQLTNATQRIIAVQNLAQELGELPLVVE